MPFVAAQQSQFLAWRNPANNPAQKPLTRSSKQWGTCSLAQHLTCSTSQCSLQQTVMAWPQRAFPHCTMRRWGNDISFHARTNTRLAWLSRSESDGTCICNTPLCAAATLSLSKLLLSRYPLNAEDDQSPASKMSPRVQPGALRKSSAWPLLKSCNRWIIAF